MFKRLERLPSGILRPTCVVPPLQIPISAQDLAVNVRGKRYDGAGATAIHLSLGVTGIDTFALGGYPAALFFSLVYPAVTLGHGWNVQNFMFFGGVIREFYLSWITQANAGPLVMTLYREDQMQLTSSL